MQCFPWGRPGAKVIHFLWLAMYTSRQDARIKAISLFTGIAGFEIGLRRQGQASNFCRRGLKV